MIIVFGHCTIILQECNVKSAECSFKIIHVWITAKMKKVTVSYDTSEFISVCSKNNLLQI